MKISALGRKLRTRRKQIEAAAVHGETTLLNKEELDRELGRLRPVVLACPGCRAILDPRTWREHRCMALEQFQNRLLRSRIGELQRICAEAYQVVGTFAFATNTDCTHLLDNLSVQRIVHEDVLPFILRETFLANPIDPVHTEPMALAKRAGKTGAKPATTKKASGRTPASKGKKK